ncbi:MAG TPA: hypothetical protein VN920_17150 [Pyrinomonadaceae bacterium]|nr:hypothetical protein [Pyrinomonadaceae bacterium]
MFKWSFRTLSTFALIAGFLIVNVYCTSWQPVEARHSPQNGNEPPVAGAATDNAPVDVDRIIRAFTAKETEFRHALVEYAFQRDAIIQTIGPGGQVTGEYHRKSQFVFDDRNERFEKITYFPQPTLTELRLTQEDLDDLSGIQPFALEASKIEQYNFKYAGKERLDELDTYVFEVGPKVLPKKISERFFQGRIWVDQRDLQIVKVHGKSVPEGNQRFPVFETYRQQIDGRYWFPTYTYADDVLNFPKGQTVHFRMLVRYTDYGRFRSKVKITEAGDPNEETPRPQSQPKRP